MDSNGVDSSEDYCTAETLRSWVRQVERDTGVRNDVTSAELNRVKALGHEVQELRRDNEILRKARPHGRRQH